MSSKTEGWALWGEERPYRYHHFKKIEGGIRPFISQCGRYGRHKISDTEFREDPEEERKCKDCLKEMDQE